MTVVADCVNPLSVTREGWRAVAASTSTDVLEVEIVCSDQTEHRRRVEARRTDVRDFTPPTWEATMFQYAMTKRSAGLLMYRRTAGGLEVLLVHPGGPYWAGRDAGVWSLPKGEYESDFEDALDAAKREFAEETGFAPGFPLTFLGEVRLRSGKIVTAWAFAGDCDPADMVSNSIDIEWPPHSGRLEKFPEADRAAWLTTEAARQRIHPEQRAFIARLEALGV